METTSTSQRKETARGYPGYGIVRTAHGSFASLDVLLTALALGVLGNLLLRGIPWGLNVALWTVILLLAVGLTARRWGVELTGEGRWMLVPAAVYATTVAWRASPTLLVLNVFTLLVVLALGAFRSRAGTLRRAGVREYLWGLFAGWLNAAVGCLCLLTGEVRWKGLSLPGSKSHAASTLRGVLIAAPLLLVFGTLFAAADPVFERVLGVFFEWDAEWVTPVFWTVFWAWISAGYLRQTLFGTFGSEGTPIRMREGRLKLGGVEVVTVLALLNLLFAAFVLVQFRYLFGGASLVEETVGLSYAEYARRGFFELAAVAVLVLPLLLVLDAIIDDQPRRERWVRTLMAILVGLLFVILLSAMQRMRLYQSEYGLTELRLYTTAFMGWLALVFVWFLGTVLRNRRERFAWGALMAGLAMVGALNVLNPDALTARINLDRAGTTSSFDSAYLSRLSGDAVPELVAALPRLRLADQCLLASRLLDRWGGAGGSDWRTWNRGRWRARQVVRANEAELRRIACREAVVTGTEIRRSAARRPAAAG